jgi:hypothetical protein
MKTYRGLIGQRLEGPSIAADTGIDYRQIACAAIYNELMVLEYAARTDDDVESETYVCRVCRITYPKWGRCTQCHRISQHLKQLTDAITFFESEFALMLCLYTDIDYDSLMKAAKGRFADVPEPLQKLALREAGKWWVKHNGC